MTRDIEWLLFGDDALDRLLDAATPSPAAHAEPCGYRDAAGGPCILVKGHAGGHDDEDFGQPNIAAKISAPSPAVPAEAQGRGIDAHPHDPEFCIDPVHDAEYAAIETRLPEIWK